MKRLECYKHCQQYMSVLIDDLMHILHIFINPTWWYATWSSKTTT